jgi:hypothetical protein
MSFDEGFVLGLQMGGGTGELKRLDVSANGTYHAADYDCDGFEPVVVNLALDSKTATQNGVYTAGNEHLVGYDVFTVALQIVSKTINANGTYTAEEPDAGYSPVIVRVPSWRDAKEFYGNGGLGIAGNGGRGYVDELMREIIGEGEHVENYNSNTGWSFSTEDGTTEEYPEHGFSFHLRNANQGKDYVVGYVNLASDTSKVVLRNYQVVPAIDGGVSTYTIEGEYSMVDITTGNVIFTTDFSFPPDAAYNEGWGGYMNGTTYSCTVS